MSVWSWMLLLFLLSAADSLDVENWLTPIVHKIRTEYPITDQFCVAVNIPVDQNPDQPLQVLQNNKYETQVKQVIDIQEVYVGPGVVLARPMNEHAEFRVLNKMGGLEDQHQDHFLVFYTYLSPCARQCANPRNERNILNNIQEIAKLWGERHALVFGKPCTRVAGCEIDEGELMQSFKELKKAGLKNIVHCYFNRTAEQYRCLSCFSGEEVVSECLEAMPQQEESAGSSQVVSAGGKRESTHSAGSSAAAKRQQVDDGSISSSGSSSRG